MPASRKYAANAVMAAPDAELGGDPKNVMA
jgi:hypothetical protein